MAVTDTLRSQYEEWLTCKHDPLYVARLLVAMREANVTMLPEITLGALEHDANVPAVQQLERCALTPENASTPTRYTCRLIMRTSLGHRKLTLDLAFRYPEELASFEVLETALYPLGLTELEWAVIKLESTPLPVHLKRTGSRARHPGFSSLKVLKDFDGELEKVVGRNCKQALWMSLAITWGRSFDELAD